MTKPIGNDRGRSTPYFSIRNGRNPGAVEIELPQLLRIFRPLFEYFESEGYFQEALGYDCVDQGFVPGYLGQNLEGAFLLELHKTHLTPVRQHLDAYSEDDLFDVIEFLFDHCSKPIQRHFHSWNNCGWHCTTFDQAKGQAEFREKINKIIPRYGKGYELDDGGQILHSVDSGLEELVATEVPHHDPDNVEQRIEAAKLKFRRRQATETDQRDAVRELADVLEFLKPDLAKVLTKKDQSDLFNIANNFGIRHHTATQRTDYPKDVWLPWMFYHYLGTIHAVLRLIAKSKPAKGPAAPKNTSSEIPW